MEMKMNNGKQNKKPTAGQLELRMRNAVLHIDKTKNTKSVYFDDKGLKLVYDSSEGYAIVETGAHRHVFNMITSRGYSRPYLYISRFVDIALETDCIVKDDNGNLTRSYAKMMNELKALEDKTKYNVCWYIDMWLFNIFAPLYSIDETELSSFVVYEQYMHNIATNAVLLSEHKEDVTNKQFLQAISKNMNAYMKDLQEYVILHAMSDEERAEAEIKAMAEAELEQNAEGQVNGEQ